MKYSEVLEWWQKKNLTTEDDYRQALENFNVVFTCNSNNIEGDNLSYHTTREIFEDAPLSSSGVLPRQIFEVRNHKFAFDLIVQWLVEKRSLSLDLIKKLHKTLMYGSYDETRWRKGERPGSFKVGDYCVGLSDEGTPPEYVEEDLIDLLNEVNSCGGNPLVVATYLHLRFETIHPFADGNGRVGRTLMNYYLMLHNYPPMVIHSEDKETYYLGLEVYDRTEEIKGLIRFFQEQTIKTWKNRIHTPYTQQQIQLARRLAPSMFRDLPDAELWDAVGPYVMEIS